MRGSCGPLVAAPSAGVGSAFSFVRQKEKHMYHPGRDDAYALYGGWLTTTQEERFRRVDHEMNLDPKV